MLRRLAATALLAGALTACAPRHYPNPLPLDHFLGPFHVGERYATQLVLYPFLARDGRYFLAHDLSGPLEIVQTEGCEPSIEAAIAESIPDDTLVNRYSGFRITRGCENTLENWHVEATLYTHR